MAINELNEVITQSLQTTSEPAEAPVDEQQKKKNKRFRSQIELCKSHKRGKLVKEWQTNKDYRLNQPYLTSSGEDRIAVPLDWTLTKQKVASLFSQVPAVRVSHPPQTVAPDVLPWVHSYEQRINDVNIAAGIEGVMDETIPDCVSTAGIGIAIVAREAITEQVEVPALDMETLPPILQQIILTTGVMPDGSPIPTEMVPRELDSRYTVTRISPVDFLWPLTFNGSDYNKAPWIGRTGRTSWSEAVQRFGLMEDDKIKVIGEDRGTLDRLDRLEDAHEEEAAELEDSVAFDEIFYKDFQFDTSARSYDSIHHVVFVHGKKDPVIDEPWQGQRQDQETGQLIGALKYPIRVLTLTYISDEAIPPSDTAIGRSPVDEVNAYRTNNMLQRKHSLPARWINTDRIDPTVAYTLMRGVFQGMIPIQGIGTNAIGEVPRSAMPQENYIGDRTSKNDLMESWQVGGGLWGSDIETKAEVDAASHGMETRISRERAKVGAFFVGIAEVLGGLISIFEDPASFGEGFSPLVSRTLSYSILADSTVLLDSNQLLKRRMQFLNFTAKSGWVNIEPVLKEIAALHGLDPAVVIRPPEPGRPDPMNISLRMTGSEDLYQPLMLAMVMEHGLGPSPQRIEEAKKLIEIAVTPPAQAMANQQMLATLIKQLIQTQLTPQGAGVMEPGSLIPGGVSSDTPIDMPTIPPPAIGDAHAGWSPMPRVNQRVLDRSKEE